jgi:hypothetical protein
LKGEVYRGFGAYFKARGDLDSASVCYDRALEHLEGTLAGPSVSRALAELGEVYLKQSRVPQAVAALRRAEQSAGPNDPALRVRLGLNAGLIAFQAGDRKRAIECYEAAAQDAMDAGLVSERELVCIGLSGLYEEEGRFDHALALLREALALSVVACLRDAQKALERQRLHAIHARLVSIDGRASRAEPGFPHRREVEETVRLYNTHPFVASGEVPQYGALNAHVVPTALELSDGKLAWDLEEAPTQTLLNSAPDRAIWGKPPGRN